MKRYTPILLAAALLVTAYQLPAQTPVAPAFHVEVRGEAGGPGRAMILIPGLSSSGKVWDTTVARYQAHYRCYVVTLAGFAGQPRWNGPGDDFLNAVRDQLAALIAEKHLERPVIAGHSLGGFLALSLAEKYPDRVGPLVIVDSMPFLAHAWLQADSASAATAMAAMMRARISGETDEQYAAYVKAGTATRMMVTGDEDFARITRWGLRSDKQTVGDAMYDMLTTDLRPGLGSIRTPVLVLGTWAGLEQAATPTPGLRESAGKEFAAQYAGVPQAKILLAGRARHFIMYDDGAWFFTQLDAFLKSTQPE